MELPKPFIPDTITTILMRLDEQDRIMGRNHAENKAALTSIEGKQDKTNGRVRLLEKFSWAIGGGLIVISTVGGWYAAIHGAH